MFLGLDAVGEDMGVTREKTIRIAVARQPVVIGTDRLHE